MSLQAAEELSNAMMVRARLIDSAKRELREGFTAEALGDVVACLEHIQMHDRSLIELHAECHGLIEYCRKVLSQDAMRRPVSVIVESDTLTKGPVQ